MGNKVSRESFFDSAKFLKAADIKDGQQFTVEKFETAKTRLGNRPLLRLKNVEVPLGLNATNFDKMVEKYGDDADKWSGKRITLRKVKTNNPQQGGKEVDGIRIE